MKLTTTQKLLLFSSIISLLTLPATFVWLEIGALGKEYYGNDVPDIYILGATITGKDKSFWGINFAYKFQLVAILFYSVSSVLVAKFYYKNKFAMRLTVVNLVLLILFPLWLYLYVDGVICNSDGAAEDLKIHFGNGLILYGVLVVLNILILKQVFYLRPLRLKENI